jgi:hypothetical protein
MKKMVTGDELGRRLVDVLGLPKTTKGFELRCYVDETVSIKCEYFPEMNGTEAAETIFVDYELVKKDK